MRDACPITRLIWEGERGILQSFMLRLTRGLCLFAQYMHDVSYASSIVDFCSWYSSSHAPLSAPSMTIVHVKSFTAPQDILYVCWYLCSHLRLWLTTLYIPLIYAHLRTGRSNLMTHEWACTPSSGSAVLIAIITAITAATITTPMGTSASSSQTKWKAV